MLNVFSAFLIQLYAGNHTVKESKPDSDYELCVSECFKIIHVLLIGAFDTPVSKTLVMKNA